MNREAALEIVNEYVKNQNLVRHMLAVEAAMRWYAKEMGEDADLWGVVGLLHDFDWEVHPTLDEHPQAGEPILRSLGVPEVIIRDHGVVLGQVVPGVEDRAAMRNYRARCALGLAVPARVGELHDQDNVRIARVSRSLAR